MNLRIFALCAAMIPAAIAPARAAELVMVDQRACVYCQKFNRQVAKSYAGSTAGQIAPLRRVSRFKKWPGDLAGVTPAYATPTFILVDDGREVGRFAGFAGPEWFWQRLNPLLASVQQGTGPAAAPTSPEIRTIQPPPLPRPRPDPTVASASIAS